MISSPVCRLLPWDSEFFGWSIARLEASRLDEPTVSRATAWCREQSVDCLYFLAAADDGQTTRLAEQNTFHLVDIRLTLSQQIDGGSPPTVTGICSVDREAEKVVRLAREADVPFLSEIARGSHRDTRFYFDPRFPEERCDQLYATWIERSCAGYADAVFVAEYEQETIGYITCRREELIGEISLVGVHARARGRGIGQALLQAARRWFEEKGLREIRVSTQGRNLPAQRLYQRNGFLTEAVGLYYHRWFV